MQFQLAPHQTSQPIQFSAGSVVAVVPATGATALVEYSIDGGASWSAWTKGTVALPTRDHPSGPGLARVTAEGGSVAVDVRTGAEDTRTAQAALDAFGNVVGQVGQDGLSVVRLKRPHQTPGSIACDWQSSSGTLALVSPPGAGESVALDSTVLIDGMPAMKCVLPTAGNFIAKHTFTNPISLASFKTLQIPMIVSSNASDSGIPNKIEVWALFSDGTSARLQVGPADHPPGKLCITSMSRYSPSLSPGGITFGGGATMASFDSLTITGFQVFAAPSSTAGNTNPFWIGPIRSDGRSVGRVSITMDGEYSSQYSILKPILDSYGIKVSLAISKYDIGRGGRMTEAQIDEMYKNGHEVIHHCYNSALTSGYGGGASSATDWPTSVSIAQDVRAMSDYMRSMKWLRGLGKAVVAYNSPFTGTQAAARQRLVYDGLRAGGIECWRQGVGVGNQLVPIGNKSHAPFMLRGALIVTNTHTAADLKAIIDQVEDTGEWAIITLHKAVADGTTPASLEMTESNMRSWIDYLATRQRAGGVVVQPMGEAFEQIYK